MKTLSKRLRFSLMAIPLLLSIPLIAMQFTTEVNWKPGDFVIMGTLLLSCVLVFKKRDSALVNYQHCATLSINLGRIGCWDLITQINLATIN